jgi:hypothetical protein
MAVAASNIMASAERELLSYFTLVGAKFVKAEIHCDRELCAQVLIQDVTFCSSTHSRHFSSVGSVSIV